MKIYKKDNWRRGTIKQDVRHNCKGLKTNVKKKRSSSLIHWISLEIKVKHLNHYNSWLMIVLSETSLYGNELRSVQKQFLGLEKCDRLPDPLSCLFPHNGRSWQHLTKTAGSWFLIRLLKPFFSECSSGVGECEREVRDREERGAFNKSILKAAKLFDRAAPHPRLYVSFSTDMHN